VEIQENGNATTPSRTIESLNNKVQSFSFKVPKKAWQGDLGSDDEGKRIHSRL